MKDLRAARQNIFDYIYNMLGGGMVDVELDPSHYEISLNNALDRYRQRSDNSVEESYFFLQLIRDQNNYTLPREIMEVERIFRRGLTSRSGSSTGGFDPFQVGQTNTYLLNTQGTSGNLATFELYSGFQELAGRMFGGFIEFNWNRTTKLLTILQRPSADDETLLLKCYNYRPTEQLLDDYQSGYWIKSYALAQAKYMIGEARSKFASIAGPQGGGTLNGDALKAEAQQEMEKLEKEVVDATAGGTGYGFLIG